MIKYAFVTNNGLVHKLNEDSITFRKKYFSNINIKKHGLILFNNKLIAGVFDGVGGNENGNVASLECSKYFAKQDPKYIDLDIKKLVNLTLKVNNHLNREQSKLNCSSMMSTMVAVIIKKGKCGMMNVGDSRGYLISDNNSQIKQKSYDDSYRNKLINSGELTKEEVDKMDTAHFITSCLGMPNFNQNLSHSFIFDVKKHDRILLMSDGITDLVSDDELLNISKNNKKLNKLVDNIEKIVLERGAHDNYTLIVLEV